MTNEEIERRFLFDLNMGRFDLFFHTIYFRKGKKAFKLYNLLYNIGYNRYLELNEREDIDKVKNWLYKGEAYVWIDPVGKVFGLGDCTGRFTSNKELLLVRWNRIPNA